MRNLTRAGLAALLFAPALGALGCGGDESTGPPSRPASVAVTSPIDTLLAVGGSAQLTATARDRSGSVVTAQFTWESSDPAVAEVSSAGRVTGRGAGPVTVTAVAANQVRGSIRLRVLQADIPAVIALSDDVFAAALVAALSPGKRPAVQAAWNQCGDADAGNLASVVECVTTIRSEAASAGDPTDRPLLAVLTLFTDRIERLLGL